MDPTGFLQPPARGFPELSNVVRREVESLLKARDAHVTFQSSPDCLFAAIQTLLVRLLPELAERLVQGSLVYDYIDAQMAEMVFDSDLSDLGPVNLLNEKHKKLRSFVCRLQRLAEEFSNDTLIPSQSQPVVSLPQIPPQQSNTSYSAPPLLVPPPSAPDPLIITPAAISSYSLPGVSESVGVLSDDLTTMNGEPPHDRYTSLDSLKKEPLTTGNMEFQPSSPLLELGNVAHLGHRGKGQYTCPHAYQCTKGGVNPDGTIVIFERNSVFRGHLQKHQKPYKCELPGCTNRTGFARADQLQRHQAIARHA